MIPKSFYSQITTIALAVAVVITYVKPTFESIGLMQDDIGTYQVERNKVIAVNSKLANLLSGVDSVTNEEKKRLSVYLPNSVDDIAVQRDLWYIVQGSGVYFNNLSYEGVSEQLSATNVPGSDSPNVKPLAHQFSLAVEGTYVQIKNLLSLLEQNEYPFEVREVSIQPIEGGFLTVQLQLFTFAHQPFVAEEAIQF